MAETQIPTDGLNYLQGLMQTGQELMQQFAHAVAAQTAAAKAAGDRAGATSPWEPPALGGGRTGGRGDGGGGWGGRGGRGPPRRTVWWLLDQWGAARENGGDAARLCGADGDVVEQQVHAALYRGAEAYRRAGKEGQALPR